MKDFFKHWKVYIPIFGIYYEIKTIKAYKYNKDNGFVFSKDYFLGGVFQGIYIGYILVSIF